MRSLNVVEGQRQGVVPSRWKCAWNWKCALMSAAVRSLVYGVAMLRGTGRERLAVIGVEMLYVTLTAGLYAGLQQRALGMRRRWLGDLCIVLLVPGLSQVLDWLIHKAVGAPAPVPALTGAAIFTLISALFHRHVMRHGTFLTGESEASILEDFRRIPRLVVSFVIWPGVLLRSLSARIERRAEKSEDFEAAA
jgi:hypothetical protein